MLPFFIDFFLLLLLIPQRLYCSLHLCEKFLLSDLLEGRKRNGAVSYVFDEKKIQIDCWGLLYLDLGEAKASLDE